MKELSLHVLDIAQNSIRANASHIKIVVDENKQDNKLEIIIEDNGCGMDDKIKETVTNPFTTTRTLRKVGLGLPFLDQLCQECEGKLAIESEKGKGTTISATMRYNHIDRLPLGEIEKTVTTLIMAKPEIRYTYEHKYEDKSFVFDTEEIKAVLDGVSIADLEILKWIEDYLISNIAEIKE